MISFCVEAKELKQKFNISVGVFDAGSVALNYMEKDDKYNISTELKTENFFGSVYPFYAKYEAEGGKVKDKIKPLIYMTETVSRNHKRTKKIFYNDKGVGYKRVSTKDEKLRERLIENVPQSADVSDLQNVFVEVLKSFFETRSCKVNRQVYDGKKHYEVIVKDEGVENRWFEAMGKNENAYKCSIFIKNLKENNDNILWDITADKPINFWVDGRTEEILEIKIDKTPLGEVKVYPIEK